MATRRTTRRTVGSPNRGGRTSMTYDMSRRNPNSATPNKQEFLTDVRASRATSSARGVTPTTKSVTRNTPAPAMTRTATPRASATRTATPRASATRTATPRASATRTATPTSAVEIRKAKVARTKPSGNKKSK